MKAKIGLLALILVLSASLSLAQSLGWWTSPWSNSFRNASTAGLLEDDLDLMLDPARLPMIQGNRLYTNLSNLVGKNDDVFDNNSNGYYLIGGSGKLMDFGYVGLMYDRYLSRANDTTNYNTTVLTDLDANGTYDRKTLVEQTIYSSSKQKNNDMWIGYGREMGPGKFGLLFYHSTYTLWTEPSVTNTKTTASDLLTGATTSVTDVVSHVCTDLSDNVNGGALSYWYPFSDKLDLGLAAGANLFMAEQFDSSVYSYKQTNPSAAGTNGTTIDSTAYGDFIPWDHVGMEVVGRVAGDYKWSDKVHTRTDVYFTTLVGGKKDDGYRNTSYVNTVAFQIPTGVQSLATNRTRTGSVKQEDGHASVGIASNTYVKFSDKVEMAIGLGLDSYNRDYTTTYDASYNETITYNDGDATTFGDYTQVTAGTTKQVHKYTAGSVSVQTPVCVEFHVTKPFVIRLGARHQFNYSTSTETYHNEVTPQVVTYTDAFGVVTQSKPTNYTNYNAQNYYNKNAQSNLDYTYGAGWEISKNLQIDLMGFAKLDDMTNWKLSAVFKF